MFANETTFSAEVDGKTFTAATGRLASLAGGAVTLRVGDSVILATATMSKGVREGLDFFPLSVDFEEKMYAAGKIPGSFFRREGRPSTEAVLTARLTDRPLRPLFPDGMRNEVQIIANPLSSDEINNLDILVVNAASAALHISDIPWNGPIGAVRVGIVDGEFVANPDNDDMENSDLDLRIAASRDAIIMVEAGANELPEDRLLEALAFGHEMIQPLIKMQEEMREAVGKEKREVELVSTDDELTQAVKARINGRVRSTVAAHTDRFERSEALDELREEITESFLAEDEEADTKAIFGIFSKEVKQAIRDRILNEGIRPDGRDLTTIRELSSAVGISPRAHGSGLFQRGETQVLSLATFGTPREAQTLDGLFPGETRRYMHHYNFPPFSTGETWFLRGPKRREIGHGALAETALRPVIPAEDEFPYSIRVVSEVLASNGSTSQASVCASTLALMDGGVPIRRPVAGVAMGLISDGERFAVLSDIQGLEDHIGDMDFKVAGTSKGITALQMDIKISGLSKELMAQALEQAYNGRIEILNSMTAVISEPRAEMSPFAPRMLTVKINPEKIGAVIGKGGANIRAMEEQFEVSVDIQEDGTIFIAGVDGAKAEQAVKHVDNITKEAEAGQIYTGKVVRVTDFGAFVEFLPGQDGMVHISQIATEHIKNVEEAIKVGDEVMVMVTDITPDGKIRLSRRAVLEGWDLEEARANDKPKSGGGGRNRRGGDRRGGDRRGGNRNRRN